MTTVKQKQTFEDKVFSISLVEDGKEGKRDVFGTVYGDTGLAYQMCPCGHGYVVTHLPSGFKIQRAHFTKSNIQTFVRALAKLTDWTIAIPKFPYEQIDVYYEIVAKYSIFTNWSH